MTTFDNVLIDSGLGSGLRNIIHLSNRGMLPCSMIYTPLQLHANVKTVSSNVVACNWTNKNLIFTSGNTWKPYYIQQTSLVHVPDFSISTHPYLPIQ